jgi:hypothetical protein
MTAWASAYERAARDRMTVLATREEHELLHL